jgi:hypothetical protein
MGARLQMSKKKKSKASEKKSEQKTRKEVDWVLAFEWAKTGYKGP